MHAHNVWIIFATGGVSVKKMKDVGGLAFVYVDYHELIRDITLPTKVHTVKTIVFPAVMYGCENVNVKWLSRVRLFVTPWTVAYQAPLSMGFSRQ